MTDQMQLRIAALVGRYVLSTGSLELELDDLLHLANDRLKIDKIIPRFPVNLQDKLEAMKLIAQEMGIDWDDDHASARTLRIVKLRNGIAHGRVSEIQQRYRDCRIMFVKMGRPKKEDGHQRLMRDSYSFLEVELNSGLEELFETFVDVERIRTAVWRSGEGWPNYMPYPSGDVFGFSPHSKLMMSLRNAEEQSE